MSTGALIIVCLIAGGIAGWFGHREYVHQLFRVKQRINRRIRGTVSRRRH